MNQTFEQQVTELCQAEERAAELRNGFDVIEVWDPFGDDRGEERTQWLEDRGCVANRCVAHSSFDGYDTEYLCPKGTAAEYEAAFNTDEKED